MAEVEVSRLQVGKVIDSSWKLFRGNWKFLVGLVCVVALPLQVVQHMLLYFAGDGIYSPDLAAEMTGGASITYWLISLLAFPLLLAPATWATGALLEGEKPSYRQAFDVARKRYFALLATGLLVGVLWVAIFVLPAAILDLLGAQGSFLLLFAVMIYFVAIVWLAIRISLFLPAVILEDHGPWSSLKRSHQITRGYVGRIILIGLVAGILAALVQLVFTLALGYFTVDAVATGDFRSWPLMVAITSILMGLLSLLVSPFFYALYTVLYLELKARWEIRRSHQEAATH